MTTAAKYLETGVESNPKNPLGLKLAAEHHFKNGNFEVSQRICEHCLKVLDCYRRSEDQTRENPNFRKEIEFLRSDIYFILGKIQHSQRNFNDALENYLKAIKVNERNIAAQFNLAKVFFFNESF